MPLTRLDNLYSSKTGKYLYVSPDDFNATDELNNRGNSPLRPFKTIQRAFIEVSRYSYLPGANNDRFDQFSIMLMPGNHYIDNRPGLVTETDVEARYFDAANLLEANKQEVIDRSVAQIAIDHPDFYIPGDVQTGEWSRYKDAYRLIQQNRDHIIDRAVAEVPNQFDDFYYPDDPQSGTWSRYKDAFRLITRNRDLIAQDAFDYMDSVNPPSPLPPGYSTGSCVRDIGFLIDAISLDVHQAGGNKYTRKYIQRYFNRQGTDWVGNRVDYTPTNVTYNPATGETVATFAAPHDIAVNDRIFIKEGGISFTCDMDDDQAVKAYPRVGIDPSAVKGYTITQTTANTITFDGGVSGPNKYFQPTAADYNPVTGDMTVTVGQHGLGVGRGVVLENQGFTFTCALDGNQTTHSYPRPGIDPYAGQSISITEVGFTSHTVTDAPYNAATGVVTLTIPSHGFANGDYIKISDGSLTYTCDLDGNVEQKAYPRAGYDYPSGRWMEISNVTANTFEINVGPSEYTGSHTFVSATANGVQRQDGTFTINVGTSSDTSAHTFVSATAQAIKHEPQTAHTFVSALEGAIEHDKTAGLRGEETSSLTAFAKAVELMKLAITNNYASTSDPGNEYQDLGVSGDVNPGSNPPPLATPGDTTNNTNLQSCSDVQSMIDNLYGVIDSIFNNADLKANNGQFNLAGVLPAETLSDNIPDGEIKCKRDVGFYVDALSLDIHLGGGNVYTRKLAQNYFDETGNNWVNNGLQGETQQSRVAFQMAADMMIKAMTNQLYEYDETVTPGDAIYGNTNSPQDNLLSGNPGACFDVQTQLNTLAAIIEQVIQDENLSSLPDETVTDILPPGEVKCRRDTGFIVDGLIADLRSEGNSNTITNTKAYFDRFGNPIANGVVGEENESITAFNAVATWAKRAVTNTLFAKDLTLLIGPAYAGADTPDITYNGSGNIATCQDVQATIDTLINILTSTLSAGNLDGLASVIVTGVIPSFNYNRALEEWQDNSIVDLADPDNVLHKFNAATGGCIVPRGCSLIGYDLRRTVVRPLYVPDPADTTQERTSIFNLTGGCYLWQFTIKDGDLSAQSPLYDATAGVGKVYYKKGSTELAIPEYSHHKICIMEYADRNDLDNYYDKVGKAFQQFQTDIDDGGLEALVQENRIVGPLSDSRTIESIRIDDFTNFTGGINGSTTISGIADTSILEVGYEITTTDPNVVVPPNTKIEAILANSIVVSQAITGNGIIAFKASFGYARARVTTKIDHGYFESQYVAIINSGLSDEINGTWKVTKIDGANPKIFEYEVADRTAAALGLVSGQTYLSGEVGGVSTNAVVLAEIDSVESASPYVFNCSIRSTWGQCGMWADGSKATGFKSMVVAQYTGVSLQKDDRAFIRYDRLTNTWNQASLTDAFATIPYHTKGDAYWKDDWRNFHIRASDDSFIQCVSVFAVGFFDHFLMESGGDMSITNSNSNFGNTSLHSVGYKGFAFNQDKGGYVTDIIPPQVVSANNVTINQWYTLDVQASKNRSNHTEIYLGGTGVSDPDQRPAASINGFRIGAKTDETLSVTLQRYPTEPTGPNEFTSTLTPSGFKSWKVGIETLTPSNANVDNYAQDAANRIEDNKALIQNEAYQYILQKYPTLVTKESITISKCERDIGYFVDAVVNDLRLGGNINSIQAAEGYYIAGQVAYIAGELNETIDALEYVKQIMIAAMRNFDYRVDNCSCTAGSAIVTVPSTQGLIIGMKVEQYPASAFTNGRLNDNAGTPISDAIQSGSYIKNIISDTQIEMGVIGSKLQQGVSQNAGVTRTGMILHFEFEQGAWTQIDPTSDPSITQDAQVDGNGDLLPECINIATTIEGYFEQIFLVLNGGYSVLGGREADAYNAIYNNRRFIAAEAVYRIATDVLYQNTKLGQGLLASTGETIEDACVDDVANVLAEIAYDIKFGGNSRTFDAANLYLQSKAVIGEEAESKAVFIVAGDIATEVMRQETVAVQGTHGLTQIIDTEVLPEYDANGNLVTPPCADIANQIATSIALINSGIDGAVIGTKTNPVFSSVDRVDPPAPGAGLSSRATLFTLQTGLTLGNPNPHDLETGTAVRLVPKAKAGTNPDKRLIRLPDGFNTNTKYYVIAPGRNLYPENFALTKQVLTVTEASGTNFAATNTTRSAAQGLYRSVIAQPKIDTDGTALARGTGLKFNVNVNADGSVTLGDAGIPLDAIASGGSRYEIGDIVVISDSQIGSTGAPDLEVEITSVSAAEYPGVFDGTEVTKLMLATSIENAAAGIYMYSPETDSVDENVEIEIQQFTLDSKYDLHKYKSNVVGASEIETSVAHIFDVPTPNTTPQKVFVRLATDLQGSQLPQLSGGGTIDEQTYFYVRYVSNKRFTLHESAADAETGDRALTFSPGTGINFYVYANKRTSPLLFNPEYTANGSGLWYVQVKDESNTAGSDYNRYSILSRFHGGVEQIDDYQNKTDPTLDTRYLRVEDERPKEDRVYRLRYVVPSYLDTVRDPLNGFVIRTRTDDKRRLVPQKVLLKPIAGNPNPVAQFYNPAGANEQIGGNKTDLLNDSIRTIDPAVIDLLPEQQDLYDPYLDPKVIEFDSKIAATIQAARKVNDGGTDFLEVTLFDHTITNTSVKNEIFTIVEITGVQNGLFSPNTTQSNDTNKITWSVTSGDNPSTGSAYLQFAIQHPTTGRYSLVLKEVVGEIVYNEDSVVTFTQESTGVTCTLYATPNSFGDPDAADKSLRTNYLYRVEGSNVYTVAPGDTITDDTGQNTYYVHSIVDQGDFEDCFYIFDIDTLQERIANQQDGIYYLTCLRGNISPYPTGSGVGENFRNFKFSQPISFLYPQNYKNDPLWFQVDGTTGVRDTALLDVPATSSAADNYVHGLVTVNDSKGSATKEAILDMVDNSLLSGNTYTNTRAISAQEGNATSGSEDRLVPISGDSEFPTDRKMYVELRRPSIARSGNHTFEYLGFGPGNYSTGFPLRQEVVLTDKQDFYAQAKREDGGIVFYTGLNSNGDLYIGNKKVNAITGEETFLESAELLDSEDEDEDVGNLVTTFDTPVTFNSTITVAGKSTFNAPVEINVEPLDGTSLTIQSKIPAGDDPTLFRGSWRGGGQDGDIVLDQNRIRGAVFIVNARPEVGGIYGQSYTYRTHHAAGKPSNLTPWQQSNVFSGSQTVQFGSGNDPSPGDVLLKGDFINKTGSTGWILTNTFSTIETSIATITADGSNELTVNYIPTVDNTSTKLAVGSKIRIVNFSNTVVNGDWFVTEAPAAGNYFKFQILSTITTGTVYTWANQATGADLLREDVNWKETGIIGAEAIRSYTDERGDYRIGINTIARTDHNAIFTANVDQFTEPRATLDVVGNSFISGTKLVTYTGAGVVAENRYDSFSLNSDQREGLDSANKATQGFIRMDNALVVAGDSDDLDQPATLRVHATDTTLPGATYQSGGRVGINTDFGLGLGRECDHNFTVIGDARITGDVLFQADLAVNGGDITSTQQQFDLLNSNVQDLDFVSEGSIIKQGNAVTTDTEFRLHDASDNSTIRIGNSALTSNLQIHAGGLNQVVDIATTQDGGANNSTINIGGAFVNKASSFNVGTWQTNLDGQLQIGAQVAAGTGEIDLFTQVSHVNLFNNDQNTSMDFAQAVNNLTMASLGGTTTIRNSLLVQASATVDSNILLRGGTSAGIIDIIRGRFSTPISGHAVSSLDNPNIDFYKYSTTGKKIDTEGVGPWGGPEYIEGGGQISGFDNLTYTAGGRTPALYTFVELDGGTGDGATINVNVAANGTVTIESVVNSGSGYSDNDTLTIPGNRIGGASPANDATVQVAGVNDPGNVYILPITTPDPNDFQIGDLLLIDRGNAASPDVVGTGANQITGLRDQAKSEIVRVAGLVNVTNPSKPFEIKVERAREGTGDSQSVQGQVVGWTDHPDECIIAKLTKNPAASYITGTDGNNDDVVDQPPTGIDGSSGNVRIGVAEFGGILTTQDFLRLDGTEIVGIADVIASEVQSLTVTDGGDPAVIQFNVNSVTGDTDIRGSIAAGQGLSKFTMDSATGNTFMAGTLTCENTLTLNGSTVFNQEFFTITNGGPATSGGTTIPLRTTFQVETSTGNTTFTGDLTINNFQGNPRLTLVNQSGDLTVYGSLSALGTGTSTFGGDIDVAGDIIGGGDLDLDGDITIGGDLTVNGGDFEVNFQGNEKFRINQNGSLNLNGITNFFSTTGARKWDYISDSAYLTTANINYFVNASGNTIILLPEAATMGDMIRIIDIGGLLDNNTTLIIRAYQNISVQGSTTNTGTNLLSGVPGSYTDTNGNSVTWTNDWTGGELVVQTPNASFGLVYAGTSTSDGAGGAPSSKAGWYLMDV